MPIGNVKNLSQQVLSQKETIFNIVIDGIPDHLVQDFSVAELSLTESLLTPSVMGTISVQDVTHTNPVKILDNFAGKSVAYFVEKPLLAALGLNSKFVTDHVIYRIDERKPINYGTEQYKIHSCHNSLLKNAASRVSKSWNFVTPSDVANDMLTNILGVDQYEIESSSPAKTYYADNIHPFQVLTEQADSALAQGTDPSFLHYMSHRNGGTHHFRSVKALTQQSNAFQFVYNEMGSGLSYEIPSSILKYEFPCDFDILSDILNGINVDGSDNVSSVVYNPFNFIRNLIGTVSPIASLGGAIVNAAFTNKSSAQSEGTAETDVERFLSLRQARLSLLDQDKIALRITVPWNPNIYAGDMISVNFVNKPTTPNEEVKPDYGTGEYLIVTLTHIIKAGGYAITVLDCVARSVGLGIV